MPLTQLLAEEAKGEDPPYFQNRFSRGVGRHVDRRGQARHRALQLDAPGGTQAAERHAADGHPGTARLEDDLGIRLGRDQDVDREGIQSDGGRVLKVKAGNVRSRPRPGGHGPLGLGPVEDHRAPMEFDEAVLQVKVALVILHVLPNRVAPPQNREIPPNLDVGIGPLFGG